MLKSDKQINLEVAEDLESLRNGTARYSTPWEATVVVLLLALTEIAAICAAAWWLVG